MRQHAHRERSGFLLSSAPGGRGGRVDISISDVAVGHTLVDIVVADPTCRDLVERAVGQDLVVATHAKRRKETHYRNRSTRKKIVPFVLETYIRTYVHTYVRSYRRTYGRCEQFLAECVKLACRECAGSGPSINMLCPWF